MMMTLTTTPSTLLSKLTLAGGDKAGRIGAGLLTMDNVRVLDGWYGFVREATQKALIAKTHKDEDTWLTCTLFGWNSKIYY